ncbi:DUF6328 family protein [Salinibacterium sp. SYSU T00001]|uniref:DUF6328 family protein n=1 Tax=Homoserinimonas sedimenticola TaxID=2986805 RepID=UPI002235F535|nr:DUF6328 family protein [Salinibacterium sedimenticola]MCW4386731.1 DUF6328 family protein [Salinibacterium sedimenticola]
MDYNRDESTSERLDRNWAELLQELRVTQTGSQILTGFLLTIAFQPRFSELDSYQVTLYMTLIFAAIATTAFGLAPVSLHRRFFRSGEKDRVVTWANRFVKVTLVGVAFVLAGTLSLIVDIVLGRAPGIMAAIACIAVVVILWFALPGRRGHGEE